MTYPIDKKLVIAVASSALFDLTESDKVFREQGENAYRDYQRENINTLLAKGVAFPFVRRFLHLNQAFKSQQPVEVILLSKNDPETGLRVFRSIKEYGLSISRAAFMAGRSPYQFIPAFNVSLFLSANPSDVQNAICAGFPAGTVMPSEIEDTEENHELRVAFDFDGVIADDESESVYKKSDLATFVAHEQKHVHIPHNPGPLGVLFKKLAFMQQLERRKATKEQGYQRIIRSSIITARAAPAHERVATTLHEWGVRVDDTFFLGGMEKQRILSILKPHIFFDDQLSHLKSPAGNVPMVHIPFGIANAQDNKTDLP